ncbi:subtilisin-like protease SBT1.5 [Tripterygium wilfordii]|uniref:subtilisin-like protease SBT1.5 n=1 Tax=Tripterygium wilfordii TaxID=458696 RepID=UPI0018F82717|nr:subtilisin-like protease SBT1.5 [Tripterygium wilfordii]
MYFKLGLIWPIICVIFLSNCLSVSATNTQTYIVHVQNDLKPEEFSSVGEWYTTSLIKQAKPTDFLYVYKSVFHGFSARLTPQQVQKLEQSPEVLGIFPDTVYQLHTTRSPLFLGLTTTTGAPNILLQASDYGSNVIIGMFDSGIWPERPSFSDEGLGPIPSRWRGVCEEGERFPVNLCNKKLIGARYFTFGYFASLPMFNNTIKSARDLDSHGTHTSSIAAGRSIKNASFLSFAKGDAAGMAPNARIAVYKVCWPHGCYSSDVLAGFDKAVEDGVDVISMSFGSDSGPGDQYAVTIGAFSAMERGIVVSASAGNSGPGPESVQNVAPWIITIGASTIDRSFPSDLVFDDGTVVAGSSLYDGNVSVTKLPVIHARDATKSVSNCFVDSLIEDLVRGKIVVCSGGGNSVGEKEMEVKRAGGAGIVVLGGSPDYAFLTPGLFVTNTQAQEALLRYMYENSSRILRGTMVFRGTQIGVKPAPMVADFSSRGPSSVSMYVMKPDVIAPGVEILGAWPDEISPTKLPLDPRRTEFSIVSGTSMACPHVSGIAVLLKGAHPNWSPAMIKSALMTTAYGLDQDGHPLVDNLSYKATDPLSTGAGHVDPERANDPGLVYDIAVDDYLDFVCASNLSSIQITSITRRPVNCSRAQNLKPWDLNYPAVSVVFGAPGSSRTEVFVRRTVTHVSDGPAAYTATIRDPEAVTITVDPPKLVFSKIYERQSYVLRILASEAVPVGVIRTEFGQVTWTDGKHQVTSPILLNW